MKPQHCTTFHVTVGDVPPDPTIGVGMILEKGRTRLVLIGYDAQHEMYGCVKWRRDLWSREWRKINDGTTPIRYTKDDTGNMLANGYRVVRPAAVEGTKS